MNALKGKYIVALIWHKQEVKTTNQIKSSELLEQKEPIILYIPNSSLEKSAYWLWFKDDLQVNRMLMEYYKRALKKTLHTSSRANFKEAAEQLRE